MCLDLQAHQQLKREYIFSLAKCWTHHRVMYRVFGEREKRPEQP